VAQLHPPGTGFPFVASYDSQGYVGGILTRLHMGLFYVYTRHTRLVLTSKTCTKTISSDKKLSRCFEFTPEGSGLSLHFLFCFSLQCFSTELCINHAPAT
jgi:hypothetical protein